MEVQHESVVSYIFPAVSLFDQPSERGIEGAWPVQLAMDHFVCIEGAGAHDADGHLEVS